MVRIVVSVTVIGSVIAAAYRLLLAAPHAKHPTADKRGSSG